MKRKAPNKPHNLINSKSKILSFAAIGNALELYDYALFGVMLPIISPKFFPAENHLVSLFFGYLAFSITFLISPIASIFWGWYGDKFSRLLLLKNSMLLMAFPSFVIACLPDFESIGIAAPIILIIMRLLQGISAGGEIIGAKIFAMEYLGARYYGLSSGVISAAGALGVIISMLMAYFLGTHEKEHYWRGAFLFGSMLFIVAIVLRKNFAKSIGTITSLKNPNLSLSILKILKSHPNYSIIVFSLGAILGVMSYQMYVFINPYLVTQGYLQTDIYLLSILALVITALTAVMFGLVLDKWENSLTVWIYIPTAVFIIFSSILFKLEYNSPLLLWSFIALGAALGIFATTCAIMMYRCFPKDVRCRGLMVNYAFGCSIFGGLTPIILNALSVYSKDTLGIAVAVTLGSLIYVINRSLKNVTLY